MKKYTFDRIFACYGRNPISISEVWTERVGWQTVCVDATTKSVDALAKQGAKVFNFLIVDEYGKTHYADFKLAELLS